MSNNRKPKILVLYDFPLKGGGSGPYIKYLTLRLIEGYGYNVAVAAPDELPIDPKIQSFPIKLPQIPVFISRPGLEESKKYSDLSPFEIADLYDAFIKETIRIVESFKPDIIHVHHLMLNSWAARFIRSVYGTKIILTSHGSCLNAISKDRRYFRMTRDAVRAANAITVVSGDTRAKFLKMFGSELSAKTRTIPGGVRMSLFPQSKNSKVLKAIAEKYKIKHDNVVLFTGRLISEKGVAYLVKAARDIKGEIVIAGDGPQKNVLANHIKQNKLTNVNLLGYVEPADLRDIYYLASVFVSPSVWDDPMPLTIIEAMAAGLPVVVTRKGGIPLAVKDKYNGFFVRPRNSQDTAEKVNRLLTDRSLRKKIGERARATVQEKFTWTKIAERMHKLYATI